MFKNLGSFFLFFVVFDTAAQTKLLSKQELHFLNKNVKVIASDSLLSCDWKILNQDVKNKNIFLLGEPNHGSREMFLLHNSLIQYLYETKGIKAVLFESGIGELAFADLNSGQLEPDQMINGFFGGWRSEEFVDLMKYLQSKKIAVAGFDVQRTSSSFSLLLNKVAQKFGSDSSKVINLEIRFGLISRELGNSKVKYDSIKINTENLINEYVTLKNFFIKKNDKDYSKELLLTIRTLENRVIFLQYMLDFTRDKDWNKRWAARDAAMADNVKWFLENIYKNEPIVILGHNYHIAKGNEQEKVMGKLLADSYSDRMYALGFFAGEGRYYNNPGKITALNSPDSSALDIKHIIQKAEGFVSYLKFPFNRKKKYEWLFSPITVNDTFINLNNGNKMTLSGLFDAIIMIKRSSPSNNYLFK